MRTGFLKDDGRFAHAVPRPGGSYWVNPELRCGRGDTSSMALEASTEARQVTRGHSDRSGCYGWRKLGLGACLGAVQRGIGIASREQFRRFMGV